MNQHRCVICGELYLDDGMGPSAMNLSDGTPQIIPLEEHRLCAQWTDGLWVGTCALCWNTHPDAMNAAATAFRLFDAVGRFKLGDLPYPGERESST